MIAPFELAIRTNLRVTDCTGCPVWLTATMWLMEKENPGWWRYLRGSQDHTALAALEDRAGQSLPIAAALQE